jgi:hypothetical protein
MDHPKLIERNGTVILSFCLIRNLTAFYGRFPPCHAEGDNRLHGFDGDTGKVVYAGGGQHDVIGAVRRYQTPILAGGRIFVAADDAVESFVQ